MSCGHEGGNAALAVPRPLWWPCVLDVEQLAWAAVTAAQHATQAVTKSRALHVEVGTDPALIAAAFAAIEHLRVNGVEPAGWAPLSGFFRAADGWVRTHANYPHHAVALTRALDAHSRDDVAAMSASSPPDSRT